MKMSLATYDQLAAAVRPYMARLKGREPLLDEQDALAAVMSERNRWNCFYSSQFDVERLYDQGLNDDHIDTALRAIAKRS